MARITRQSLRAIAATFCATAVLSVSTGVASATNEVPPPVAPQAVSASEANPDRFEKAEKICDTYVRRTNDQTGDTQVIGDTCSEDPALRAGAERIKAQRAPVVVLVEFWSLPDLEGLVDRVYGWSGPCDPVGYRFSNLTTMNANLGGIRSYVAANLCYGQEIWTNPNFAGNLRRDTGYYHPWVGPYHDGAVRSMKVYAYPVIG